MLGEIIDIDDSVFLGFYVFRVVITSFWGLIYILNSDTVWFAVIWSNVIAVI